MSIEKNSSDSTAIGINSNLNKRFPLFGVIQEKAFRGRQIHSVAENRNFVPYFQKNVWKYRNHFWEKQVFVFVTMKKPARQTISKDELFCTFLS